MGVSAGPDLNEDGLVLHLDAANKKSYPAAGSLYFDGNGDYLTLPTGSQLEFGSGDFTVEFWYYTSTTARQWFIHASTDYWFGIDKDTNGKIGMWASSNGTSWNMIESDSSQGKSTNSISLNTWNHIAYTRSGNNFRLFINGILEKTVVASGAIVDRSAQNKRIGRHSNAGLDVNGYISDFRITKGVARYTSNFTPSQLINHLTDQYKSSVSLLLQTSAGIKDYSDNSFPITIVGNTTISTQTNVTTWIDLSGKGNNATLINGPAYNTSANGNFDFDGSNDYALVTLSPSLTLSSFTYNIWFKAHTLGGYKTLIDFPNDSNYFGFLNQALISYGPTFNTGYVISTGVWYNASLSYTYGGAFKFYLNGVLIYTSSNINNSKTSSNISIAAGAGPNEFFDGLISIVQLYNRGLSHLEVLQNFNAIRGRYGI